MTASYDWTSHFSRVDEDVHDRFVHLTPEQYAPILEQRGLPRVPGEAKVSAENRVSIFGDVVLKVFRPGRWSLEALQEEVVFLEDLREAGVSAVRPIGGIETWEGLHHLAYERVADPYEDDRPIFTRDDVAQLVTLAADVHRVGAMRDAPHRPRLEPVSMGRGLLEVIDARGYLSDALRERYHAAVEALCAKTEVLLEGVPQQRIHADFGSWNVLWREDGPLLMDLDDFQVGPTALDVRLLSFPWRLDTLPQDMDRRTRREHQHELVVELYRAHHDFDDRWAELFRPTAILRGVVFDAWFSHNWSEPGFAEHYEDDDITQDAYWQRGIDGVEAWLAG